ncbi:MAG: extensin family protein [Pseudomonadota bacterium]
MIAAAWLIAATLTAVPMPPAKPEARRPAAIFVTPFPKPPRPAAEQFAVVEPSLTAPAAVPQPVARPARFSSRGQSLLPGVGEGPIGAVCQDPRLEGRVLTDIVSANRPCGVLQPVRISRAGGIPLSTPATLNCPTARRFADWLSGVAEPAVREELGKGISSVWVMGSYSCRTRNNQPGARISEHARGRAIDVGGLTLSDGSRITVRDDWGKGAKGAALTRMHRQSCGLFQTVLGPDSDVHHKNHFHFDTAQRPGEPFCR